MKNIAHQLLSESVKICWSYAQWYFTFCKRFSFTF